MTDTRLTPEQIAEPDDYTIEALGVDLDKLQRLAEAAVEESEDLRSGSCEKMDALSEVMCDPAVILALVKAVRATSPAQAAQGRMTEEERKLVDDFRQAQRDYPNASFASKWHNGLLAIIDRLTAPHPQSMPTLPLEVRAAISQASNILFNLEQESGPGKALSARERASCKETRELLDSLTSPAAEERT